MYLRELAGAVLLSVLVLLCSCTTTLRAQFAPETDSLKSLLEQTNEKRKVRILHELSDQTQRSDIDSALGYAREALILAKQLDDEKQIAESHRKLGRLFSMNGQHPAGLEHLLRAKTLYEELADTQKFAHTTENLGALYKRQSNYKKSLECYYKAYDIRKKIDNQEGIANTLHNIGIIHERLNQPEKSAELYKQALQISKHKNDVSRIAIIATQLGNLYADTGNMDEGLRFMNQALEASEQLPGEHARATILLNVSTVYNNNESYRLALEANREAFELADSLQSESLRIWAQKNMAEIHENLNEYQIARQYLLQALTSLEDGGSVQQIINTRNHVSRNYLETGDYELAADQARRALDEAKSIKAFKAGLESLHILTELYKQTGDSEKAVHALEQLTALKDSVYNREQTQKIAEMQARYETEQKEKEIALLRKQKEKETMLRNASLAGLILIGIIALLVYNRQRLKIRKNQTELENRRLKEQQLEQDLAFRNKQLTTHTLHLVQKNETMKELKEKIGGIRSERNGTVSRELRGLENLVDYSFNLDDDWEQFQLYFEQVHTGFFDKLKEQYPDLTPHELRLSALAKLNLTIKETATILGITPDSVKTARYRLRKKLDIETEENLTEFMMNVEKGE